MSSRTDIIIAGGGMAGASLALALAQAGKTVAVIEPKTLMDFDEQQSFDLRVSAISPASRNCLLYTSPSPRDKRQSRMPSSA